LSGDLQYGASRYGGAETGDSCCPFQFKFTYAGSGERPKAGENLEDIALASLESEVERPAGFQGISQGSRAVITEYLFIRPGFGAGLRFGMGEVKKLSGEIFARGFTELLGGGNSSTVPGEEGQLSSGS